MDPASHAVFVQVAPLAHQRRTIRDVGHEPLRTADTATRAPHEGAPGGELAAFETEFRRIASDLHDTAAQALAVVRLSLEAAPIRIGGDGAWSGWWRHSRDRRRPSPRSGS